MTKQFHEEWQRREARVRQMMDRHHFTDNERAEVELFLTASEYGLAEETAAAIIKEGYMDALRAAQKAASRAEDERRLAVGEVTAADLHRENSLFGGMDIQKVRLVGRNINLKG